MWPFAPSYPELSAADVNGKTYDYIVVGGGTSGCILASRLSEDPSVSVLVLEKGSVRDNFISRIPLLSQNYKFPFLQAVSRLSEPIEGFHGRRTRVWAVEGMGGATRINGQLLTRGVPGGYNQWAEEFGLTDWAWDKVEPYFRRSENSTRYPDAPHRGHSGPIENRPARHVVGSIAYADKAAKAVGLPFVMDGNDPKAPAQGNVQLDATIDSRGQRLSSYKAWLNSRIATERRSHLSVCTRVVASKLVVDKGSTRVKSVQIQPVDSTSKGERDYIVNVRREVILCSGALCTPQLLQLSGIGPREVIEPLGIPVIKELPAVGRNLTDHISVPICFQVPQRDTLHCIQSALTFLWHLLLYLFLGIGLLAESSTCRSIFVKSSAIDDETLSVKTRDDNGHDLMDPFLPRNVPDIEVMVIPVTALVESVPGISLSSWYATIVQPYSRGTVEIASTDPEQYPRLDHPMLKDNRDLTTMHKAVRFAMRLTEEFQSVYPHPVPFTFGPGMDLAYLDTIYSKENSLSGATVPEVKTVPAPVDKIGPTMSKDIAGKAQNQLRELSWRTVTDEDIDAYIRRTASSCYHVASTCRMSRDPKDGVVDQRLKVHGFQNLRIADASVFPFVTSAHTMAPTIMVAERCADFLKEDWRERKDK
ncbi:alcohol oxidase [Corynascus novoguineensis]|uniref:Alcohol oxidase n=1 Tax=Corynascus novoguineensis TaxID=1126955 RepID=A0AAN7CTU5_9PEZI|nr:alcohol oxidase [Corynascus novoguineensis]